MYTTHPKQIESDFPVFSTVNVSAIDASNVEQALAPVPDVEGLIPPYADPDRIVGRETDALILAIHAIDPGIGFPNGNEGAGIGGPGNPNFFDSVIGFTVLEPGAHTDISVPIFAFDGAETARGRIPEGETYPPNPNGETEVVAQLWTPMPLEEVDEGGADGATSDVTTQRAITPYPFLVQYLTVDGEPVRDSATVSGLDQNPDQDPLLPDPALATMDSTTDSGW